VILRAIILAASTASVTAADPASEQFAAGQACYDRGDWPCAFDNLMPVYEEALDDRLRCDQGRDEVQDGGQGCGFTVGLLYDLGVKASVNVLPERRREVSERYLKFLTAYGVSDRKRFADGLLLGANALRLDACIAQNDQACAVETSATILALVDTQPAADLDGLIESALMFDQYPLDLHDSIARARKLTEGNQP
jgi:hypothetical protein